MYKKQVLNLLDREAKLVDNRLEPFNIGNNALDQ